MVRTWQKIVTSPAQMRVGEGASFGTYTGRIASTEERAPGHRKQSCRHNPRFSAERFQWVSHFGHNETPSRTPQAFSVNMFEASAAGLKEKGPARRIEWVPRAILVRLAPGLRAWPRLHENGANMQLGWPSWPQRPLALGHAFVFALLLGSMGRHIRPVGPLGLWW